MKEIEYSIVIPVYNSAETLEELTSALIEVMNSLEYRFEIIFVDDNSRFETWETLLKIKKIFRQEVTIIRLTRNFGQNGATACGIDFSKGKKVITIDDDMHTHPIQIKRLIERHEETRAAVVYGEYSKRQSFTRRILAMPIKFFFKNYGDGTSLGSSFRLIDEYIVDKIKNHSQDHLFINQVINWYTRDCEFVAIEDNLKAKKSSSRYNLFKLIAITLRLIYYYTNIPLKIIIYLCAISVFLLGYFVVQFWSNITPVDTIYEVMTIIIILGLLLLLGSISVLSVYVNRIYNSRIQRPHYAVKMQL